MGVEFSANPSIITKNIPGSKLLPGKKLLFTILLADDYCLTKTLKLLPHEHARI